MFNIGTERGEDFFVGGARDKGGEGGESSGEQGSITDTSEGSIPRD